MSYPSCRITDCPNLLQEVVSNSLTRDPNARILSVQRWENTPYIESIDNPRTLYLVFMESGNYYMVHKLPVASNSELQSEVVTQGMTAGEIRELIAYSDLLQFSLGINQKSS